MLLRQRQRAAQLDRHAAQLGHQARPRGVRAQTVGQLGGGQVPIHPAAVARQARRVVGQIGILLPRCEVAGLQAGERFDHQGRTQTGQAGGERVRRLLRRDRRLRLQQDGPRVEALLHLHDGDAGRLLAGGERRLDGRRTAVARQQGRELAELTRRELDLGSDALSDIAALIEQNFAVDVALSPLGTEADGLCVHCGTSALILASSDFPDGHLRFTLAHELGHHLLNDPDEIIEETTRDMFADTAKELRVNAFAGHFLMPERGLRLVLEWLGEQPGQVSERSAVALMEHFGVSMAALVYQLNVLGVLNYDDGQKLRNRGVTSLVNQHRDVAPSGAATAIGCIHRAPERLTRRALAAAREQRLGLSAISSLLERDDDEQLWNEIMADHSQATAGSSIVL